MSAILQGGDGTHSTSDREASLWRYFNTSCFHGTDDSSPGSFYSVYRSVFRDIHEREQIPDRDYCSFGASSTPVPEMLQFYARWENFVSVLTFADADIYHTLDAPNRATRRVMEKENLKQRETARKEYTEQVRSLARFVKKRDPRYLAHEADLKRRKIEEDEAKKRLKIESELLRKEMRCKKQAEYENDTEALEQREKERKKAFLLADNEDDADEHCHSDDEQLLQDQLRLLKMSDPDDLVYTGDAARTDTSTIEYNCDICSKVFRSEMQLKQHLSSKPHLKKLKDISKSSKAARSAPPLQL
jgi:DnaJ family protein A protein 5